MSPADPSGGLGRFIRPKDSPERPTPPGLKRFLEPPAPEAAAGERCEMCNEPIPEEHSHVVNIESRALMCTCRPCYLLFTKRGAAAGKFVSVPDRYLHDPDFALTDAQWEQLQIPVRMAFFFLNSTLDKTVTFYPSPAGATESLLPMDTWGEVMAANPLFSSLAPDVEALLIYKQDGGYECFLAPIDACYELVGLVRMHWRGFDGGEEAWTAINNFFDSLRERSRPVHAGSRPPEAP